MKSGSFGEEQARWWSFKAK